jgi:hypothetical protein
VAQRTIELVVGRLITDEAFRARFHAAPDATLAALSAQGHELTRGEMAALLSTDPAVWTRAAEALDPRLQKIAVASPVA